MKKFDSIDEVAEQLSKRDQFTPDLHLATVGDVLTELVAVGQRPEVHDEHDDFLSLEEEISQEVRDTPIEDVAGLSDRALEQVERIIEQANIILPIAARLDGDDDADEDYEDEDEDEDQDS